jgi:hypothetical protein
MVVGMTHSFLEPNEANSVWGGSEDPDSYQIVALDPGGTTGWCILSIHPDAMEGDIEIPVMANIEWWTAGQFTGPENAQCDAIVELIESWPSARLVSEKFILRSKVTSEEVLSLERMNAILGWAVRPRYFVLQQPSLAMSTITDDRQKDLGFWLPGQQHARDAVKHALTFAKRKKEQSVVAARKAAR